MSLAEPVRSMERPIFPHSIDSTTLSSFRSCAQKAFRSYLQHWKPRGESVHLVAGGAFAKGLEVARKAFYEGRFISGKFHQVAQEDGTLKDSIVWVEEFGPAGNAAESISAGLAALILDYGDFQCPSDSAKSLERTCGALEFYFDRYPLGADGAIPLKLQTPGKSAIEFSFAEPLPINHPVTGDPLLYCGRSDMIASFSGGTYIFDEKTTSSLGASWSRQWDMRSQFTGYAWAASRIGLPTSGTIVRGVSILKTKYDTQQAITYRAPWEIDRWLAQTVRDIERMVKCWQEGYWDYSLDHACTEYGGCSFVSICKSPNPQDWLPVNFEQRVWDPLARAEISLAEYEAKWKTVEAQ